MNRIEAYIRFLEDVLVLLLLSLVLLFWAVSAYPFFRENWKVILEGDLVLFVGWISFRIFMVVLKDV